MSEIKAFNVILICRTAIGQPSFFCAKVKCTEEQYENVDHLDMVCEAAEKVGLTVPGFGEDSSVPILCDENDMLGKILDYGADWEAAQELDLAAYLNPTPVTA